MLPEESARPVDKAITEGANNDYCPGDQVATGHGVILTNAAVESRALLYTLEEKPAGAAPRALACSTITVGTSNLTVSTDTISGTLAFSNTVDAGTVKRPGLYRW